MNIPWSVPNLRPESEILVCCARTAMDSQHAERLKGLAQQDVDWKELQKASMRHGLMPLVYWNLNQVCPELVPTTVLAELRSSFEAQAAVNLALTNELLKILNLFQASGILAIPYKGPTLTALAYGNLALRQFSDLDILVQEGDILKTKEMLSSHEYRAIHDLEWEHSFVSKEGKTYVDLHQRIAPLDFATALKFDCIWKRLQPISLYSQSVLSFSPEDLLLILCIYIVRDCWQTRERLIEICDIAELIRTHPNINWEWLIEEAHQTGTLRILLLGLFLAHQLLEAEIPQPVLQKIEVEQAVKPLAKQVYQWLFCKAPRSAKGAAARLFYFQVRERKRDTAQFFTYRINRISKTWIKFSKFIL